MNKVIISFCLLISMQVQSGGVVDNGGGLAESRIAYSYKHFSHEIKQFLDSWGLSLMEKEYVKDIIKAYETFELENGKIYFKKGSDYSFQDSLFDTEEKLGSNIYLNQDKLYQGNILSLTQAYQLILEILSFQIKAEVKESKLLLSKFQKFLEANIEKVNLSPYGLTQLEVKVVSRENFDVLIINDEYELVEIQGTILDQAPCPSSEETPDKLQFENLHLGKVSLSSKSLKVEIASGVSYQCQSSLISGIVSFNINFEMQETAWKLKNQNHHAYLEEIQFYNLESK
jgi:hypothetical protein